MGYINLILRQFKEAVKNFKDASRLCNVYNMQEYKYISYKYAGTGYMYLKEYKKAKN